LDSRTEEEASMKLQIITIVLDGYRFLPTQFYVLNSLPPEIDWHWWVSEGVADNTHCTQWCKKIEPRLSNDGTTGFLRHLNAYHPRVHHFPTSHWDGKVSMFNHVLKRLKEPCVLMEIDADELWTSEQIQNIYRIFTAVPPFNLKAFNCARFFCRYFVGPNLVAVGEDCYGNNPNEWLRAWRYEPGMTFKTHEPPCLSGVNEPGKENCVSRKMTRENGMVFDHPAYMFREQVAFKETFYGYADAVKHWERLQAYEGPLPTPLKPFLHWVDDRVQVGRIWK
jgi:hypothetical protein